MPTRRYVHLVKLEFRRMVRSLGDCLFIRLAQFEKMLEVGSVFGMCLSTWTGTLAGHEVLNLATGLVADAVLMRSRRASSQLLVLLDSLESRLMKY